MFVFLVKLLSFCYLSVIVECSFSYFCALCMIDNCLIICSDTHANSSNTHDANIHNFWNMQDNLHFFVITPPSGQAACRRRGGGQGGGDRGPMGAPKGVATCPLGANDRQPPNTRGRSRKGVPLLKQHTSIIYYRLC